MPGVDQGLQPLARVLCIVKLTVADCGHLVPMLGVTREDHIFVEALHVTGNRCFGDSMGLPIVKREPSLACAQQGFLAHGLYAENWRYSQELPPTAVTHPKP